MDEASILVIHSPLNSATLWDRVFSTEPFGGH
jgi:hypothetical protein